MGSNKTQNYLILLVIDLKQSLSKNGQVDENNF